MLAFVQVMVFIADIGFLEKENMKNLTGVNVNFGNVMITMTMGLR